jgi:hypothetical protein
MKRAISVTDRAVDGLLRDQSDLITRSQVLSAGMTTDALRHKLRAGGPWRTVLPGVYLAHSGLLAGSQREVAAVLYAGRGCVITSLAALNRIGVRVPPSDFIDVLIPESARRQSVGFVRVHRTARMPQPRVQDGLRWAPTARAVADAARGRSERREVRALVAEAVQRRRCTVQELAAELQAGPTQGSAALRAALAEVAGGAASVAEADLHKLIKSSRLPEPMYNPRLYVGTEFLAQPDAWWHEAGVACEVDSREWHLSPDGWERTIDRHARMSAVGIIVIHVTPRRLRSEPATLMAQLRSAIQVGRQRTPLLIRAVPRPDGRIVEPLGGL